MSRSLQIRELREEDLVFADEVRASCGWNQTWADWRRMLAYEPEGCFCALWDGERAGTITTTRYGTALAWIGMMLVHPQFRRRGISTALMNQAIRYLQDRGVRCIKLDATPEGETVYQKLGFEPEFRLQRWEAVLAGQGEGKEVAEFPVRHRDLDREVFGADRSVWLERLVQGSRFVVEDALGYGMAREGMRANYLGPVVASTEEGGELLIHRLVGRLDGLTFWDIPEPNEPAGELARRLGFQPTRTLLRMRLGERLANGRPERQFGIGEPATG